MSGHVAFPLSDGEILAIRVALEPGEIDLDQVREGAILWGFDAFLGERVAKNKFCEEILAWPYRRCKSLRGVRLEVSTSEQRSSNGAGWQGGSFGLACVIAFSRSQSSSSDDNWPLAIATGVMRRVGDRLLVDAVGQGQSFSQKLSGVLVCPMPPEYFIYPASQPLSGQDNELLARMEEEGIKVLAVSSVTELYDEEICPRPPRISERAKPDSDINSATKRISQAVQFNEDKTSASERALHQTENNTNDSRVNRRPGNLAQDARVATLHGRETTRVQVPGRRSRAASFSRTQAVFSLMVPFLVIAAIFSLWSFTKTNDFSNNAQSKETTDGKLAENPIEPAKAPSKGFTDSEIASLKAAIDNEEALEKFSATSEHKAWALSNSGTWDYFGDVKNASLAAGLALERCRSRNLEYESELPCRVVNVDGKWVKDYEVEELPYDLTGADVLVKNKSTKYFEETYEPDTRNKALAASISGHWASRRARLSSEVLLQQALQLCQKNNDQYETHLPCRVVNVNGQWRDKPYLRADAKEGLPAQWSMQSDIENPFVDELSISEVNDFVASISSSDKQFLSQYKKDKQHKALAYSNSGLTGRGEGYTRPVFAATYAQEVCLYQNKNNEDEFPCRVVNVDGMWVKHIPQGFRDDLAEEEQLITKSAIKEYKDSYSKLTHAKVFVASNNGKWATRNASGVPLDQLGEDALEECRSKNALLESKYPCRVINANGLWVKIDPLQPVDTDRDGMPDQLEVEDGSDPENPASYKDTDSDGVADRYEQLDGTDPFDGTSVKDTDKDGVADRLELFDGTKLDDRLSYKDADKDGVPDFAELRDRSDPNDARSFKDSDGDGVSDRAEIENGSDPNDSGSFLDTDKDDVPDYVELISNTDIDDPNSYPDADGDSVPDLSELIDGTDPNDASSFKDSDGDSVPDRYEPLEFNPEYLDRYKKKIDSKALVTYKGKGTFTSGRSDSNAAMRLAIEGCYLTNEIENDSNLCRVVNVDGLWIKHFNPPQLADAPGLSMITTKKVLRAFTRYESFVNGARSSKAFVYSLGGWYSMDVDSRKPIKQLANDLLQDCQRKNEFWESRYPCRVVNINGQWGVDSALIEKMTQLRKESGSLTKDEVASLKEAIDDPENVRKYENVEGHKVWALSDTGVSYLSFRMKSLDVAMGLALEGCRRRNQRSESEFPCRIVNVEGEWVKDIEAPKYPVNPTGEDVLVKKIAQNYFKNIFEPITHNKVIVASLGGEWAAREDPVTTLEELKSIALKDCQYENRRKETIFPCRVVNENGRWRQNPFLRSDSITSLSKLENPIVEQLPQSEMEEIVLAINSSHEKWHSAYGKLPTHKALAYSDSTAAGRASGFTNPRIAARIALDICHIDNKKHNVELPCRVVNVDGLWAKNYLPSEFPDNLTGKDLLTTMSGLSAFDNEYSNSTDNRVFVASLSGVWVVEDEKNTLVETQELEALKECRSKNGLLESKYPCRVISVNGRWLQERLQKTDEGTPGKVNIESGVSEIKRISDNANSRVEFNPDSSVLTTHTRSILRAIADLMKNYPTTTLEITGYTDSYGEPAENIKLSKLRADACAAYIAAQGISLKRLEVYGRGSANPITSNTTSQGRKRNRRVEFSLKE